MSALRFRPALLLGAMVLAVIATALNSNATTAQRVEDAPNGSWVKVKGTVVAQREGSFILDHGEDTITVEVDSWERSDHAESILNGYNVTVHGRVDNDFYHERRIEADTIHVAELDTVLTGPTPVDEEEVRRRNHTRYFGPIDSDIEVVGTVTGVSGREFTIDTGDRKIAVNTAELDHDPLSESGFQHIEVGDFVRASGDLTSQSFDEREIMAETVISLGKMVYDLPNGE